MRRGKAHLFDLYGTLVDIHTDKERLDLWQELAVLYGEVGAVYGLRELWEAYRLACVREEAALQVGDGHGLRVHPLRPVAQNRSQRAQPAPRGWTGWTCAGLKGCWRAEAKYEEQGRAA